MSEFLSFKRLNDIPLCIHTTFYLSGRLSMGGFHFLTVVRNDAVNTGVRISLQDPAFNCFSFLLDSLFGSEHP